MALHGTEGIMPLGMSLPAHASMVGQAAHKGTALIWRPDQSSPELDSVGLAQQGFLSVINVPLEEAGSVLVCINLASKAENAFGAKALRLLTQVSALIGTSLERRHLESRLPEYNDDLEGKVRARTVEIESAKDAAETANRAKSEFLANMSHELRTPLHGILSFSEFGIEKTGSVSTEKLVQYFEQIRSSGTMLLGLVDALLDLAKLESGLMELSFETVELTSLMTQTIEEFDQLASDAKVRFDCHYGPETVTA